MRAISLAFTEVYQYREVLWNLLLQDLKVKYQRTYLGYFWSLLTPLLQLAVLSVIFSHITRLEMSHYTLYLFSGLLTWSFFQSSVSLASRSFLENENFIKKVYLPKTIFPLTKVLLRAIDYVGSFLALLILGLVLGFPVKETVVYLPLVMAPVFVFTLGVAILCAITTVFFRDIEYIIAVFMQLLYFATPILYPLSALPERYQAVMQWNPVFTQIRLFHEVIYFGRFPTDMMWVQAWGVALLTFVLAMWLLRSVEDELVFRM